MSYYITFDSSGGLALAHHGIKGQRWGVRRYQNEDGTLTLAGVDRYRMRGTTKGLNRLAKDIARTKYKRVLTAVKREKALDAGKDDKAKELDKIIEKLDKSIAYGEKNTNYIIKDLTSNGVRVSSVPVRRYAGAGRMLAGTIFAGPVGPMPFAILNIYRLAKYGYEAGGIIDSRKYKARV